MKPQSLINTIIKDNLCIGCGLCESVCGRENAEMKLNADGFFYPVVKTVVREKEEIIDKICPGKNIVNDHPYTENQSIWGEYKALYSGYSTDNEIRTRGSSGGIVSAIAIHLLENETVNAVLQVGGDANDYERNTLKVSRTRGDVLACASSRYAPALIFNNIDKLLNESNDIYAFIGKPCDISALKNYLSVYPQHTNRFRLTVSIMCAGMSSFNGTKALINEFEAVEPIKNLVYRGNGWPGYFSFIDGSNKEYVKTYNDSWGKTLNRHLNFRCKICPDGIGLQADIAVGDAWETKDGYPDFTEKEGQSLVIARTLSGCEVLDEGKKIGTMFFDDLEEYKLALMQPYQYSRRTRIGARLMALYIGTQRKAVNFKNLGLYKNTKEVPAKILFHEFYGTLKRVIKNRLISAYKKNRYD